MLILLLMLLPTIVQAATYTATPGTFGAMLSRLGPGDTLQLASGTYPPMSYHRFRFPSGTSWGNAPRIVAAPGARVTTPRIQLQGSVGFLHFSGINVNCAGGSREGVYLGPSTHHVRVQNAEISGCGAQGVLVPKQSGGHHQFLSLNVHHNGTRPHYDHGFYISAANNTIANSHIHHNAAYGVHVYTGGDRTANNNLIWHNRIENNGQLGSTTYGLLLTDGNNNKALNNVVRNNGSGDIRVGTRANGTILQGNQTGVADFLQSPVSHDLPAGSPGPPTSTPPPTLVELPTFVMPTPTLPRPTPPPAAPTRPAGSVPG